MDSNKSINRTYIKHKLRNAWDRTNERTGLFSLSKVYKYINNYKPNILKLNRIQKEEVAEFWGKYNYRVSYDWHELFYTITGSFYPEFVQDNIFHYGIKRYLNDRKFVMAWGDKCYLDHILNDIPTPKNIIRNVNGRLLDENYRLIDIRSAENTLKRHDALVIKPSVLTSTGKGVKLINQPYSMSSINNEYKKNYVIQIPIKQHQKIAALNPSSVNCIRINSLLLGTECIILSAFVKVGERGAFADNSGNDRYFIGVTEEGMYKNYAIDHSLLKYTSIPSKFVFDCERVPSYSTACEMVKEAHKKIPHFGLAFWDVCICEDGTPMVVEVNLRNPDSYVPQAATGPLFGKYTGAVLDYVRYNS